MQTREPTVETARPVAETEELAQVVVAKGTEDKPSQPWYVTLRPWLFCLLFLFLAEIAARITFDKTTCLRSARFDNFPTAASQDIFMRQIARDKAFRVVIIGDSVVVGSPKLKDDERIPRHLEAALHRALPGREIHVWDLSMVGMRSLDQYCMVKKVLEVKPDMVVIEANYFLIAQDTGELPLNHPWLARSLPEIPDFIRPELKMPAGKEAFEERLTDFVERNVRLIGAREVFNGLLLGVQSSSDPPNPLVMATGSVIKNLGKLPLPTWRQRHFDPWQFRNRVDYFNPIRPDNRNANGYRYILQELRTSGVPGFMYLTPQNPVFTNLYMHRSDYMARRELLARIFADPATPYRDYSDLVPDAYFADNDHMVSAGNRKLAEQIAADLKPIIEGVGSRE
jgi:hypothetical protein